MRSPADAAPSWVLAPDLGEHESEISLGREESHYVARVCRARAGDRIHVTDGRGLVAVVELTELAGVVRGRIEERREHARVRRAEVWCGAPEGRRADWLVEKLAELGIATWQPIDCEAAGWSPSAARTDRWERLADAALRQSRRCHRMEIRAPRRLPDLLAEERRETRGWWGDEGGEPAGRISIAGVVGSIGVIGPSPGLAKSEKDLLEASGFQAISLSDSRLRTETAALAWAAWWSGQGLSGSLGSAAGGV